MTEVTRVPLLPIQKDSLTKLWAGAAALALAGAALAFAVVPPSIDFTEISAGDGPSPTEADVAFVNYVGKFTDGKTFDEGKEVPMPVGNSIPGFDEALQRMKPGGKYRVMIPWQKGYGDVEKGPIPPKSDLVFDVEMLGTMPKEEYIARMQMMQQMMQGGGPGGPGGPHGAPGQ